MDQSLANSRKEEVGEEEATMKLQHLPMKKWYVEAGLESDFDKFSDQSVLNECQLIIEQNRDSILKKILKILYRSKADLCQSLFSFKQRL